MNACVVVAGACLLGLWPESSRAQNRAPANHATNVLEIQSITQDGKTLSWRAGAPLRLKPRPGNVSFGFGPSTNAGRFPVRLRYQLEGAESAWHEGGGEMFFTVRFFDDHGEQVGQKVFSAKGDSPGWNGSLTNSTLTHRRETVVAPPRTARLWVVISSAGGPATVGLFVVDDLVVSRLASPNGPATVLLRSPFGRQTEPLAAAQSPAGWLRDGIRPSMARVVELGQDPTVRAFAILDDDPFGHAEWHNLKETAPSVSSGDPLVVEWNELFTMGVGDVRAAHYGKLPPGEFRFRVLETTALGEPTGSETSLVVWVPWPLWERSWFWGVAVASLGLALLAGNRYFAWQRMRQAMLRLTQQRLLERERLRIAQDIHDDLGARVTQISLLSALAQGNAAFPETARNEFDRICRMSRDLVSALYETVWTVKPENDNLEALGNYLCQMVNQLCAQARLRCRLHVADLPAQVQLSSQTRHNLTLAVKEAVHNVIKHARASEVTLGVELSAQMLRVAVRDDGCGFAATDTPRGHGLANMQRRLAEIGGRCSLESAPGKGTVVELRLPLDLGFTPGPSPQGNAGSASEL